MIYTIVWQPDADGDWGDAANWNPDQLPGSSDIVDIDTADFHTITYSAGATTVETLVVNNDDFDLTGGTLTVTDQVGLGNVLVSKGGTLALIYGSSAMGELTDSGLVSLAGTCQLRLGGGGTAQASDFAIASVALLEFPGGAFTFSGGGTLGSSGSIIEIDNSGSVTIGAAMNIGGELDLEGFGTLTVTRHTTVFGPLDCEGGQVTGSGTLTLAGGVEVDGFVNMVGDGKVVLQGASTLGGAFFAYNGWTVENQGTLTLAQTLGPAYFDLSEGVQGITPGRLINESGGTIDFSGNETSVFSWLPTTFTNDGTIENTNASDTYIGGGIGAQMSFVNNGTVTVQSGSFTVTVTGAMNGHGSVTVDGGATFTLDASASSAANRIDIASGDGMVSLTGGAHNDLFFFGANFSASDFVDGGGGTDWLLLDGDYSAGLTLGSATLENVAKIALTGDHNYTITTLDGLLAGGQTLKIDASALGTGDVLDFDGSAETNGHFIITGGMGADNLTGGSQSDIFVYRSVAESTDSNYDTINAFDFGSDKLAIPGWVGTVHTSPDHPISTATFDDDMAAAVSGLLKAHTAVYVQADGGTLNGETFLVIDCTGAAGFQSGADIVIHLNAPTGTPTTADFI